MYPAIASCTHAQVALLQLASATVAVLMCTSSMRFILPCAPCTHAQVALLQLASATVAVLVRTSSMRFILPEPVRALMSDPAGEMSDCW